jgi:putative ABC transport system permease protein
MKRDRVAPPALAERFLAAAFGGGDWADSILGDLHEEYADRRERSPRAAIAWYWLHACRLAARGLMRRTRRNRTPRYVAPQPIPQAPGDSLMRTLGLEIRHSLRGLAKRPVIGAIVVVTLALGLGANATVFSLVDALVLRPFTMRDVDRIMLLSYTLPDDSDRRGAVSNADFVDLTSQQQVFDRFAGFRWWDANLVGRDEPEAVQGFRVSADFLPALGIEPVLGRGFLKDEEIDGRHRRVILGHGLWERRFTKDPSIVGKSIDIDGQQYEVVGIAPAGFDFPLGAQLWAPLSFSKESASSRRSQGLTVIGHLAAGRTIEEAKAEMAVIGERLTNQYPDTNRGRVARVYTLAQGMRDIGLGPILSMWQASAIFILLIACANVANLLLARGAERQREMAVRLAIGASRARVVREHLIESCILSIVSIPAALALTWVSLELIVAYMPAKIARFVAGWYSIGVDGRLVLFTVVVAIGTGLLFGLIPALQGSKPRLAETLKEGGRGATAGAGRLRLRRSLVVAEMALALPLLVAAGLSVTTVYRFLNGPQGYDPDGLLSLQLVLTSRHPDDGQRRQFVENVLNRLRSTSGVAGAAAANIVPAMGNNWGTAIEVDGKPNPDPANPPSVDYRTVTPDYFPVLRVPMLRGRGLTEADREETQPVAVISESMARRYWPNSDPIGRRVKVGSGSTSQWVTVVGVCGDVIHDWFARRNYPTLYRPFRQAPTGGFGFLVRTPGVASLVAPGARAAVHAVDPAQPVFDLMTMRESLKERTIGLQFIGAVMFAFGGIALVLAIIGVYGVMAQMVTQRTHEIGVRMALGATERDVLGLTVRQTGTLTLIGVGIGLVLAFALNRLIEAGLMGVASTDLRLIAGIAGTLAITSTAAGYLPARRAASIDPVRALRAD